MRAPGKNFSARAGLDGECQSLASGELVRGPRRRRLIDGRAAERAHRSTRLSHVARVRDRDLADRAGRAERFPADWRGTAACAEISGKGREDCPERNIATFRAGPSPRDRRDPARAPRRRTRYNTTGASTATVASFRARAMDVVPERQRFGLAVPHGATLDYRLRGYRRDRRRTGCSYPLAPRGFRRPTSGASFRRIPAALR